MAKASLPSPDVEVEDNEVVHGVVRRAALRHKWSDGRVGMISRLITGGSLASAIKDSLVSRASQFEPHAKGRALSPGLNAGEADGADEAGSSSHGEEVPPSPSRAPPRSYPGYSRRNNRAAAGSPGSSALLTKENLEQFTKSSHRERSAETWVRESIASHSLAEEDSSLVGNVSAFAGEEIVDWKVPGDAGSSFSAARSPGSGSSAPPALLHTSFGVAGLSRQLLDSMGNSPSRLSAAAPARLRSLRAGASSRTDSSSFGPRYQAPPGVSSLSATAWSPARRSRVSLEQPRSEEGRLRAEPGTGDTRAGGGKTSAGSAGLPLMLHPTVPLEKVLIARTELLQDFDDQPPPRQGLGCFGALFWFLRRGPARGQVLQSPLAAGASKATAAVLQGSTPAGPKGGEHVKPSMPMISEAPAAADAKASPSRPSEAALHRQDAIRRRVNFTTNSVILGPPSGGGSGGGGSGSGRGADGSGSRPVSALKGRGSKSALSSLGPSRAVSMSGASVTSSAELAAADGESAPSSREPSAFGSSSQAAAPSMAATKTGVSVKDLMAELRSRRRSFAKTRAMVPSARHVSVKFMPLSALPDGPEDGSSGMQGDGPGCSNRPTLRPQSSTELRVHSRLLRDSLHIDIERILNEPPEVQRIKASRSMRSFSAAGAGGAEPALSRELRNCISLEATTPKRRSRTSGQSSGQILWRSHRTSMTRIEGEAAGAYAMQALQAVEAQGEEGALRDLLEVLVARKLHSSRLDEADEQAPEVEARGTP